MKLNTQPAALFTTVILGIIISLAGCSSTGMDRSEETGITMMKVENDIRQSVAQIDATAATLEELIKPGQSDVKKAFDKYSDNVDKMEDLGQRLFEHADKMSAQGKEYFEEWKTQGDAYANPQIQALSEQRRSDLSAIYVRISEASVGVKGASRAYMSDIAEIRSYLSNDLTPKGVESIMPVARKAIQDGNNLKNAVDPVLSAIGSARAELAQGGTK